MKNIKELYQPCDIILIQRPIKSLDLIPLFIQIGTRCRWNHMGLAMTSKKMIHAHGKDENGIIGVTIDSIDSVEGKKQILRFAGLTKTQAENIISYAYSQEGKKFNWWTFFGKSDSDKNKLSCSDIVNNSFLFAGIELSYWMPRSFMYDKRFIKINVE